MNIHQKIIGYLPYGLPAILDVGVKDIVIGYVNNKGTNSYFFKKSGNVHHSRFKPLLKPLDSLNESFVNEHGVLTSYIKELFKLIPEECYSCMFFTSKEDELLESATFQVDDGWNNVLTIPFGENELEFSISTNRIVLFISGEDFVGSYLDLENISEIISSLYEYGFDFHGLINDGLAKKIETHHGK